MVLLRLLLLLLLPLLRFLLLLLLLLLLPPLLLNILPLQPKRPELVVEGGACAEVCQTCQLLGRIVGIQQALIHRMLAEMQQ